MEQLSIFETDNFKNNILKSIATETKRRKHLAWMNSMGSKKSRYQDGYLQCLMDMESLIKRD